MTLSTIRARAAGRPRAGLSLRGLAALVVCLAPARAVAQQQGFHAKGQAGATLTFGATEQQVVSTQVEVAHADSTLALSSSMSFRYGEADDAQGVKSVLTRSMLASLSADGAPYAAVSPYLFATVESSLEKRLAHRESGGAGVRWSLARSAMTNASVSVAVLGEYSQARRLDSDTLPVDARSSTRMSVRGKVDHKLDERLSFSQVTFYQPTATETSRYLVSSTTTGACSLSKTTAITVSLVDNYDSDARDRGARSNNDGQLLFGIRAAY